MIDGGQDGILLATWQALNLLQPLQDLAAGLALLDDLRRGVGLEQLLNWHIEGGRESQGHLCGDAELAYLVVRDDNLDDVDALGEFALTYVPQGAGMSEALAEGQVDAEKLEYKLGTAGNHRSDTLKTVMVTLANRLGTAGNYRSDTLSRRRGNRCVWLGTAGNHRSDTLFLGAN